MVYVFITAILKGNTILFYNTFALGNLFFLPFVEEPGILNAADYRGPGLTVVWSNIYIMAYSTYAITPTEKQPVLMQSTSQKYWEKSFYGS